MDTLEKKNVLPQRWRTSANKAIFDRELQNNFNALQQLIFAARIAD